MDGFDSEKGGILEPSVPVSLPDAGPGIARQRSGVRLGRVRGWLARNLAFNLIVILPIVLGSVYFGVIASDQYVSEARFIVRSPMHSAPSPLSSFLQSTGIARAQDDAFAVQDYIDSRDAVRALMENFDLVQLFGHPDVDPLSRYPGPFGTRSFERLYRYFEQQIEIVFDPTSGVTTLRVRAFSPEDSRQLANALLDASEALINRLNDRSRRNSLRDAEADVARMEARVAEIHAKIGAFRNREELLDPTRQSVSILDGIAEMQKHLETLNVQIAELARNAPNSPLLQSARQRAAALQNRIEAKNALVAGGDDSMVPKITEYDQLNLEREFADRGLLSATSSLELARSEAQRQLLYLERIVAPNLPDYPLYPRRLRSIALLIGLVLLFYSLLRLVLAGVREHRIN